MMTPALIYSELTPRQIEARERSIALLREQMERYPTAANFRDYDKAIAVHQNALREGAVLIENNYVD